MSKPAEIKKQVEYYLSDKNLVADKFFNEKLRENKEVSLSIDDLTDVCLGMVGYQHFVELQ